MTGNRQRGAALVLVMAGMVALLAMVGLAIDVGHLGLNKARLQNTVDAAALTAAKVLDQTGSEDAATTAAESVFDINADEHPELKQVMGSLDISIQYSATLQPFAPGTAPANYVRVAATNFSMWNSFTSLVGVDELNTGASAVAGPSPTINNACNIAPVVVCGDPASSAEDHWGYDPDDVHVLKLASGNNPGPIGPGNFQLIRLGGSGGNVVRQNMAGSYAGCVDGEETVETQTGNLVGPVTQGLNTRFGEYSGGGLNSTDYPPDRVTTSPSPNLQYDSDTNQITQNGEPVTDADDIDFNYSDYLEALETATGSGVPLRRELVVPIADCTGSNTGNSELPVLGFGCYFLLQPAVQQGTQNYIFGQFLESCQSGGVPGPDPGGGPGPYVIQLYNDVGSNDS